MMKSGTEKRMKKIPMLLLLCVCLFLTACSGNSQTPDTSGDKPEAQSISAGRTGNGTSLAASAAVLTDNVFSPADIPAYSGAPYVAMNGNIPYFTADEITDVSFESYSDLDSLGRCRAAFACCGRDLMPTEKRGDISEVKPSGWRQKQYDFVDGNSLYNRCHLLAYKLTAENANEKNLITGTRYFNTIGMTEFEDMVTDYVKETGNHVMYRVTPVFTGDNLLSDGVLMEAESVEDNGEGVLYCVFVYNVQPGVEIDYATGRNWLADDYEQQLADAEKYMSGVNYETLVLDETAGAPSASGTPAQTASAAGDAGTTAETEDAEESDTGTISGADEQTAAVSESTTYILNTNRSKFHYPDCPGVADISESNKRIFTGTRDELIDMGYSPCSQCSP